MMGRFDSHKISGDTLEIFQKEKSQNYIDFYTKQYIIEMSNKKIIKT